MGIITMPWPLPPPPSSSSLSVSSSLSLSSSLFSGVRPTPAGLVSIASSSSSVRTLSCLQGPVHESGRVARRGFGKQRDDQHTVATPLPTNETGTGEPSGEQRVSDDADVTGFGHGRMYDMGWTLLSDGGVETEGGAGSAEKNSDQNKRDGGRTLRGPPAVPCT